MFSDDVILIQVAKKRSLFDDKPKEIDELTYLIKQDINNLNSEILRLQGVMQSTGNWLDFLNAE